MKAGKGGLYTDWHRNGWLFSGGNSYSTDYIGKQFGEVAIQESGVRITQGSLPPVIALERALAEERYGKRK